MKKILITGISGFAGSFLAEYLLQQGDCEIIGTSLSGTVPTNVAHIQNKIRLVPINLLDAPAVVSLIESTMPDEIYHLAALTSPAQSFENPAETVTNNITAEINILEALKKHNLTNTKTLVISSADIYGLVDEKDLPIDEDTPLRPTNPYAVSKIAQDFLGLQYVLSYKLAIVRARPFNHIGPRQAPAFVVARFAKVIAEIEKGKQEPIMKVGNLEAKRDFTDVRDMVQAYSMLLDKAPNGEVYNIGTGVSHTIADVLQTLIGMSKVKITTEQDPSLMRPADNPEMLCDATKMKQLTGWQPTIPFEKTLQDILDYWRGIV